MTLGKETFDGCERLRRVIFREGSRLKKIGEDCFICSGIEEIELPETVTEIGDNAFKSCSGLRIVWVEDGCAVDVRKHVDLSVAVISREHIKQID